MNKKGARKDTREKHKKTKVSFDEFKEVLKIFKSLLDNGGIKLNFFPFGHSTAIEEDRFDYELASSEIDKETFEAGGKECIGLLHDIKSERLEEKQVAALAEAIEVLGRSGGKGKEEIQKILLDAGIFTVPKIEGLAELYADEY